MKMRFLATMLAGTAAAFLVTAHSQTSPLERSFPQSKVRIEGILSGLHASMSGRLPVLDGFAKPGEYPLDRYQRGYYQCDVEVKSTPSGGALVRVTAKVTAWYADPGGSHSGYKLLTSNGRLEADLLEQLDERLAKSGAASTDVESRAAHSTGTANQDHSNAEIGSSPQGTLDRLFTSRSRPSLPDRTAPTSDAAKATDPLQAEYDSLQEILKNTGHPKNLVAVKKSGTPVVSTPSLTAKPQFLASLHDEFELLDFNADWVHVRISGLSRGWIWRNSVEMPEGISDNDALSATPLVSAADLFHVIREETAPFPGDWPPLRSQSVRIISVQMNDENAKRDGSNDRLEYAKFLLEKNYKEIAEKSQGIQGIVVIFDSADGGMIAATNSTLEQWITGKLTDSALWHQCFFDPPEIFDSAAASAGK